MIPFEPSGFPASGSEYEFGIYSTFSLVKIITCPFLKKSSYTLVLVLSLTTFPSLSNIISG
jgi:hypothetical protein